MTKTYLNKRRFTEHELLYLVQRINKDIIDLTYRIVDEVAEIVTIKFADGFKREVNVCGDSLHALTIDVLNRI